MTRRRIVGHGELLKALNALPGCTDQRFRIASMYLSHATPPQLGVFVKTTKVAALVGCTKRSVELCRRWLEEQRAILVTRGGGRGKSTVVDFEPLAEQVKSERGFAVSAQTANDKMETANAGAETAKPPSLPYEEDPHSRTTSQGRQHNSLANNRSRPKLVDVATSMIAAGGYRDEDIIEKTGLTVEELTELQRRFTSRQGRGLGRLP